MDDNSAEKSNPTDDTARHPVESLADGILILLALTVVQRSVGFVRSVLFCRWLDPEQLGQWDMAFGFLMMAAPLSVLALASSFRRYVEYYRQRGILGRFLRHTTMAYFLLGGVSVALVYLLRPWVSTFLFGTSEQTELVAVLAIGLAAVIAHHYFLDLFGALRNARLLAAIQMANSLMFAVVGILLLSFWRCEASSVVIAYAVACAVCALAATLVLRRSRRIARESSRSSGSESGTVPLATECPPQSITVWAKILPFVGWITLANLMGSLFEVTDRYMIVHFSSYSPSEALAQVGLYHGCRVIPLLLVSVVAMAGSIITPHLACDWESGRRDRVGARLQLLLKLFAFGLTATAVLVLYATPLLFGVAFGGKFDSALGILPWTLTYCIWFALFGLLQNYAWCCERAYYATGALLTGVVLNVGLNLLLLPRLGLLGAVLATAAANIVALTALVLLCRPLGLRLDRASWIAVALPISVCLGPWLATLVLTAVVLEATFGVFLFSPEEKQQFADSTRQYLNRASKFLPRRRTAPLQS